MQSYKPYPNNEFGFLETVGENLHHRSAQVSDKGGAFRSS
jgi:hypothetical protein